MLIRNNDRMKNVQEKIKNVPVRSGEKEFEYKCALCGHDINPTETDPLRREYVPYRLRGSRVKICKRCWLETLEAGHNDRYKAEGKIKEHNKDRKRHGLF